MWILLLKGGQQTHRIQVLQVVAALVKMIGDKMLFWMIHLLGFILLLTKPTLSREIKKRQPHIIVIYVDDLGWNDVSFHGSPQVPTPNIDALAQSGILLNRYYGEWLCTPSRAALMTGKYPIRLGLQHLVITPGEKSALPLNETILPQHLQRLGYETHMVGKWHLGYYKRKYMPTQRGFKSHIGYLNGAIDYFDYSNNNDGRPKANLTDRVYFGVDFYNGTTPIKDFRGPYVTHFFTDTARDIIMDHDTCKPLFLYLSQLAVHASGSTQSLQAPPEEVEKYKYISDKNRRIYAGKTACLDESVGNIFKALHQKNMLKDSIILFLSDNGGEVNPNLGGYGTNYPLRGMKHSMWEGALRVPALIWSPLFKLRKPIISDQLLHVTDWLPTLYRAAGGDPRDLGSIDGKDVWDVFTGNSPSPRTDLLHNIDPVYGISSYLKGDLKIINGTTRRGWDLWYGPTGFEDMAAPKSMKKWVYKNGSTVRKILKKTGMWIVKNPDKWYNRSSIRCKQPPPETAKLCNPDEKPCLFNITSDPCEYNDLADDNPQVVKEMMGVIADYQKVAAPPQSKPPDPQADPMCHNFTYVAWLEEDLYKKCDYLS